MSRCLIILVTFLVAAASYVLADPPKEIALSNVADKTLCPIEVVIDDDFNRLPQHIQTIKCAPNPHAFCSNLDNQPSGLCCHMHHQSIVTECVEIYDWVEVKYIGEDVRQSIKVPVGCSCLIEQSNEASEVPPALV